MARSKGSQERDTGTERPGDRDKEMGTSQETETQTARQRCGDPEMEKGAVWRLKTQRPRDRET